MNCVYRGVVGLLKVMHAISKSNYIPMVIGYWRYVCTYVNSSLIQTLGYCNSCYSAQKVVLSGTNNLKSVRFFKLVLRYDYSIVLYMFLACTMQ